MRILALSLLTLSSSAFAGGEEVYNLACKVCHGEFGGKPVIPQARNLKTSDFKNAKGATLEGILDVLEKGLPGTAMVAQLHVKLEDRKAVAAWIVSQRQPAAPPAAEEPPPEIKETGKATETGPPAETGTVAVAVAVERAPAATISIATAMAFELRGAQNLGLTVYKGGLFIDPELTILGLTAKMPAPVMPGLNEGPKVEDEIEPNVEASDAK
ncbi:MAG: cytochrome c [Myxococcota bacterium]|nr:cytochrome c [Myxococcota bacterium]